MLLKLPGDTTLRLTPAQLQAALPDGYTLVDSEGEDAGGPGRSIPGQRGHIDKSSQQVLYRGEIYTAEHVLLTFVLPNLPETFTATDCHHALQKDPDASLLTAHGLLSNTTVIGRTLAAIVKRSPDKLGRTIRSGTRFYTHTLDQGK